MSHVCRCSAYPFPHREYSGACEGDYRDFRRNFEPWWVEEKRLDDRERARDMNAVIRQQVW